MEAPVRPRSFAPALSSVRALLTGISPETRRFILRATIFALAVRIAILMTAYVVGYAIADLEGASVREVLRNMLDRWDALNYKIIAEHGYPGKGEDYEQVIVFLPLYPYAVRAVEFIIPSFLVAGMLISAIASVIAGYFIQAIARFDGRDEAEAGRTLWFFFLFPTAYFLVLPYTEGLFMALLLGSFYNARRGNWLWAGILGGFCTATRLSGIILLPALAVEALHQKNWRGIPRGALYLVIVPTGLLIYLWINYHIHGDIFAFSDFQKQYWYHERITPWESLRYAWERLSDAPGFNRFLIWELLLISTGLVGGLLIVGVRWLRPSYLVFGWLTLLMFLSVSFEISLARYIFTIFPIYFVLARLARNPELNQAMLSVSAVLMGTFYVIYARGWGF
jgi:hypothetical protein